MNKSVIDSTLVIESIEKLKKVNRSIEELHSAYHNELVSLLRKLGGHYEE